MIGSQALVAEPRATAPVATAWARVAARPSATPTTEPTDERRRPDLAPAEPDRRLGRGETEPVDELRLLVGPEEEIDRRIAFPEAGPIRLPDGAAGQDDPQRGVGGLEAGEVALPADHLLLGGLADRAGVDDDEVGVIESGRLLTTGAEQSPGHLLGVAPVHLAAERPDVEAGQRPRLRPILGDALVGRFCGPPRPR